MKQYIFKYSDELHADLLSWKGISKTNINEILEKALKSFLKQKLNKNYEKTKINQTR